MRVVPSEGSARSKGTWIAAAAEPAKDAEAAGEEQMEEDAASARGGGAALSRGGWGGAGCAGGRRGNRYGDEGRKEGCRGGDAHAGNTCSPGAVRRAGLAFS